MQLPKLYPILDAELLAARNIPISIFAKQLSEVGIQLLQYRDKTALPQTILTNAALIREQLPSATLLLNDRPDLALLAKWQGTHVGQTDLHPDDARKVLGPHAIIGISTHNPEQIEKAIQTSADYIAIGPIFNTTTKQNPEPTTGLALLKQARKLTTKPIIAIGGISLHTAPQVIEAGADSIALISALIPSDNRASATPLVEAFLKLLS